MLFPSRLDPIATAIHSVVESDPRVIGVYVFGSCADGTATPDSDVDLGVLFGEPSSVSDRVRLADRLSDALEREVDLVDAGACGAFLALSIIRGERLYCADDRACDEFDLYVMRRAADLEPFERERRRMLLTPNPVTPSGKA